MKENAGDAARYYRLGVLHRQAAAEREAAVPAVTLSEPVPGVRLNASAALAGSTGPDPARQAFERSVELYRRQVKAHPRDGRLLAQFSIVLHAARRRPEAERVARQAVTVAPQEWRGWAALGDVLDTRAGQVLFGSSANTEAMDWASFQRLNRLIQKPPSPELLGRWRKLSDEARRCIDRAVALAPREPEAHVARVKFRVSHGVQRLLFGDERPRTPADAQRMMFEIMLSPGTVADLQQVARLRPRDTHAIATGIFCEIFSAALQKGLEIDPGDEEVWDMLPEKTKASAREAKARLENLSRDKEIRTAAGASALLGLLQMVMNDGQAAEASLRRAIMLDPSHEHAWDLLAIVMEGRVGEEGVVEACVELLKQKDSVQGRLTVARVHEKSDELLEAEEQVRAALKLQPNSFTANLALAILLLKADEERSTLAQVGKQLEKMGKLAGKAASPDERTRYALARGIYYSRIGDLARARQVLQRVPKAEPANQPSQ
jgi:tetratricopeptide (TPR) repeat protein